MFKRIRDWINGTKQGEFIPTQPVALTVPKKKRKSRHSPTSRRGRGIGIQLAGGQYITPYTLHLMEANGCDMEALSKALGA